MHDYNRITYEVRERQQRREREAAAERIAAQSRASRHRRHHVPLLGPALRYLHPYQQGSLETDA
jgi:hypothetical protein